jgi:hypothetical protein
LRSARAFPHQEVMDDHLYTGTGYPKVIFRTTKHLNWLIGEINKLSGALRSTFDFLMFQLKKFDEGINDFEEKRFSQLF